VFLGDAFLPSPSRQPRHVCKLNAKKEKFVKPKAKPQGKQESAAKQEQRFDAQTRQVCYINIVFL
jgi:hypothetical protein